jgi:TetR/AcrR family tetracycline transcriptional repressor
VLTVHLPAGPGSDALWGTGSLLHVRCTSTTYNEPYGVQLSSVAPRTAAPHRARLDRNLVVDAALAVADDEGLEAVTIRRLAQELSVTPMALYWHFKDKDALLAAVADRVWDDTVVELDRSIAVAGPGRDEDGWLRLRLTLEALITAMRRHPAVAASVPSRVVECEAGLSVTERTLAFLADRGFDASRSAEVARFVLCSAVMLVDSQPGAEVPDSGDRQEVQRRKQIALASLPAGRYPHIVAAAPYLTDCTAPDSYFDRGIDLVVAGVISEAPADPERPAP